MRCANPNRDPRSPCHNLKSSESVAVRDSFALAFTASFNSPIGNDKDDGQPFEADVVQEAPTPASNKAVRRNYALVDRTGVAEPCLSKATILIVSSSLTTPISDSEPVDSSLAETPASDAPPSASRSLYPVRDFERSAIPAPSFGDSLSSSLPAADNLVDLLCLGGPSASAAVESSLRADSLIGSAHSNQASGIAARDLACAPAFGPRTSPAVDPTKQSIPSLRTAAASVVNLAGEYTPSAKPVVSTSDDQVSIIATSKPSINPN